MDTTISDEEEFLQASSSDLLENLEKMFRRYYMDRDMFQQFQQFQIFNYTLACYPSPMWKHFFAFVIINMICIPIELSNILADNTIAPVKQQIITLIIMEIIVHA